MDMTRLTHARAARCRLHRFSRLGALVLAGLLAFLLVALSLAYVLLHGQLAAQPAASPFAFSAQRASDGLDPNLLSDPAHYDTRPCASAPSDGACSGKYPVTPLHVSPTFGVQQGAGACLDQFSHVIENQHLTDSQGQDEGVLQLWWSPTCLSAFGHLSLSFAPSQVSSLSIWVQSESYGWFQQISQLPPWPLAIQETGPVPGGDLTQLELYSPLLYSPTTPVSAQISVQLTNGESFVANTASYTAGVEQYRM